LAFGHAQGQSPENQTGNLAHLSRARGISILQMLLQRYRDKIKRDGEGAIVVEQPDIATRQMRRRQTR
jgi:hypothetical protein